MAEYSKEFIEKHFDDPEFPWDFSIDNISIRLQPNQHLHAICEGYGFISIYRTLEGERSAVFEVDTFEDGGRSVEIVAIKDLDRRYSEGSLPWQKKIDK